MSPISVKMLKKIGMLLFIIYIILLLLLVNLFMSVEIPKVYAKYKFFIKVVLLAGYVSHFITFSAI